LDLLGVGAQHQHLALPVNHFAPLACANVNG